VAACDKVISRIKLCKVKRRGKRSGEKGSGFQDGESPESQENGSGLVTGTSRKCMWPPEQIGKIRLSLDSSPGGGRIKKWTPCRVERVKFVVLL